VGPDGAPWFTDGGQNAIVRVDPATKQVKIWRLPPERMPYTNLNTAAFDGRGRIWFTGQNGIYGRLDPKTGDMNVWDAPKGRGPYGITSTPKGDIWFVSLAGSYLANVDLENGATTVYGPPTKDQGARRVWSDSKGRLWISEWNSGNVSVYDPVEKSWKQWQLPGDKPRTYAVWVDPDDKVWLSEWTANAIVRFDPTTDMRSSRACRAIAKTPTCVICSVARVRRGLQNRALSGSVLSCTRQGPIDTDAMPAGG
jgi:virginiamycin B lyase